MTHSCLKCNEPTDMWIDDNGETHWICGDCLRGTQGKQNKYHNNIVELDGYTFQSELEAARWRQLKDYADAGLISDLEPHKPFDLIDATIIRGIRERGAQHKPDFFYIEKTTHQYVVEDTKSNATKTDLWVLKRKLFIRRYPHIEYRVILRKDMS